MECSSGIGSDAITREENCYDVVIVGFGPAALAQAIALYEQKAAPKKVLVLEKSARFSWRGNELPDGRARMRTNFMQDLVTARNPTSEFTFVNYLWATDNLVGYTNLGLINPPRQLFGMYLEWCAKKFEHMNWVQYGREVLAVEPRLPDASSTDRFRVRIRNGIDKSIESIFAKKVIIAPGMTKQIPATLQQFGLEDRVAHSTDLAHAEPKLLQQDGTLHIAIVGGSNDEAVEVLEHCMAWDKQVQITLFADGDSIHQADKNAFAGNALLASSTSTFESLNQRYGHGRSQQSLQSENLSSLYTRNYAQHVRRPGNLQSSFEVIQFCQLVGAEKQTDSNKVTLRFQNAVDHTVSSRGPFDFVFAASGYSRGLHERLIAPLKEYFDDREGGLSVNADYRVNLDRRFVDRHAGIWMLDGFEDGAYDAFPFMALRAERVLRSMLSVDRSAAKANQGEQRREPAHRAVL